MKEKYNSLGTQEFRQTEATVSESPYVKVSYLSLIAAGDSGGSGVDHSPTDADVAKGLNPGASTKT